ncbi:MAG: 3-hydroxybutyrate oligomer hydrolase family protein [Burkholderiales bacterium]
MKVDLKALAAHRYAGVGIALPLLALVACGDSSSPVNTRPDGVATVSRTDYPATAPANGGTPASQDLLTGGLGKSGIGMATAPAYADPASPTVAELRRNALYSNYRGLIDPTSGGGWGRLYGPNIDLAGNDTLGEGLIPGVEYLAVLDDPSGHKRTTMAVQIPSSFDQNKPCIVVGPSSGSRGVYGAIGSASEWGLKKGCAVALTDTGKGVGLYDPMDDTVNRVDGPRATRTAAGAMSNFAADISDAARAAYNTLFPNRLALKHVHSRQNPEKDWGSDTLAAARYALFAINEEFASGAAGNKSLRYDEANTIVIAASVSNGGGAVLQAAEQDDKKLIDGVVASEPNAQPKTTGGYAVQQGGVPVPAYGRSLMDYFSFANIYQPCAALAPAAVMTETSFYNFMTFAAMNVRAQSRCDALAAKGLVSGADTNSRATDALQKLRAYGWLGVSDTMHNAHYGFGNAVIISMMYTNAYGRFGLADNLCGMSAAQVNPATGDVVPVSPLVKAGIFASGNGTVNGLPATVVYNDSVGGAKAWQFALSPSTGTADFALDAALCQRALTTGVDPVSGSPLGATGAPTKAQSDSVRAGVAEVLLSGNLRGKPAIIVAGRSDALLPVNHNARAYTAFNRSVEGASSRLSYIEVANAQHFDAFNALSGFDTRFVPLHVYLNEAMNAMYATLTSNAELPPSQVVRAAARGGVPGAAPPIQAGNLPKVQATPAAADRITSVGNSLNVPD